jgi:hypothetical protein
MSARDRWRRADAEHWVHVLGMLLSAAAGIWTFVAVILAAMAHAVWLALLPAGVTALVGTMTTAWRTERPWSWWAWAVLGAIVVLGGVGGLLTGGNPWIHGAWLAFGSLLLVFLAHPDSRARIDLPPPAASVGPVPSSHRPSGPDGM